MKYNNLTVLLIISLLSISLVIAIPQNADTPIIHEINYSLIPTVNNSELLEGFPGAYYLDDTVLSESQVDGFCSDNGYLINGTSANLSFLNVSGDIFSSDYIYAQGFVGSGESVINSIVGLSSLGVAGEIDVDSIYVRSGGFLTEDGSIVSGGDIETYGGYFLGDGSKIINLNETLIDGFCDNNGYLINGTSANLTSFFADTIGSSTDRITKGWFTDLDVSGNLTDGTNNISISQIMRNDGDAMSGNLNMSNNNITNVSYINVTTMDSTKLNFPQQSPTGGNKQVISFLGSSMGFYTKNDNGAQQRLYLISSGGNTIFQVDNSNIYYEKLSYTPTFVGNIRGKADNTWGGIGKYYRPTNTGNWMLQKEIDGDEFQIWDWNQVSINTNIGLTTDNGKLILGAGANSEIYDDGTNLIFNTNATGSGDAWFSKNVSATGYITRTTVWDENQSGRSIDNFKSENELKNLDGSINHSAYGSCYTQTPITDLSRPEIENYTTCQEREVYENYTKQTCSYEFNGQGYDYVCVDVIDQRIKPNCTNETKYDYVWNESLGYYKQNSYQIEICQEIIEEVCTTNNRTIYPYTKIEDGVSMDCLYSKTEDAFSTYRTATDIITLIGTNTTPTLKTNSLIADEIYTNSKTIKDGVNYKDKFRNKNNLLSKTTHPSRVTMTDKRGNVYNLLKLEDRIVDLEGLGNENVNDLDQCLMDVSNLQTQINLLKTRLSALEKGASK